MAMACTWRFNVSEVLIEIEITTDLQLPTLYCTVMSQSRTLVRLRTVM